MGRKGGRRTLGDHFDIDIMLPQHTKHSARNTHHVLHLLTHQTHNRHLVHQLHRPKARQFIHGGPEVGVGDVSPVAVSADEFTVAVEGHGDVDFGTGDEVDGQPPLVQDCERAFEETTRGGAFVGTEIDYQDAVFHGYGCRAFCATGQGGADAGFSGTECGRGGKARGGDIGGGGSFNGVWEDRCPGAAGIRDVPYSDGNAFADDLLHGEWVNDLRSIER